MDNQYQAKQKIRKYQMSAFERYLNGLEDGTTQVSSLILQEVLNHLTKEELEEYKTLMAVNQ